LFGPAEVVPYKETKLQVQQKRSYESGPGLKAQIYDFIFQRSKDPCSLRKALSASAMFSSFAGRRSRWTTDTKLGISATRTVGCTAKNESAGVKTPGFFYGHFSARLKSCPDTKLVLFGPAEAVPLLQSGLSWATRTVGCSAKNESAGVKTPGFFYGHFRHG
jgi:hypothetical protein